MNKKRVLLIGVFFGIFLTLLWAGLVSADPVVDPIKDWFADWTGGENLSPKIVKYLLWALVSMAVYSVGANIPGLSGLFRNKRNETSILGIAFSVIVGFLAMAYITPDEVYAIMLSYSGMGFAISAIIPFLILSAFTFTLLSGEESSSVTTLANRIIAEFLWFLFAGFIVYKIIWGSYEETLTGIGWVIAVISIGIGLGIAKIARWVRKEKLNVEGQRTKEEISRAARATKGLADYEKTVGGTEDERSI